MNGNGEPFRGVVLVGFMGAGKTSVGKVLAVRLDAEFADVDEMIERSAGRSIGDIFASDGEKVFRRMEKEALREATSVAGRVLAAGGGAFIDEDNRKILKSYAPVVFLDVSGKTVISRLSGDRSRPLFPGEKEEGKLLELMERRRKAYLEADFSVSTDNRTVNEVAGHVLGLLLRGTAAEPEGEGLVTPDILTVALGERTYDIFFGEGFYPLFQEWICRFYPGGAVYVVTDRNVASIYGEDIHRCLTGIPHLIHVIEPGEDSKNWETVRGIYSFLAEGNADREALVVAFGGGVVGDLAGFAAATYLRGISYLQIPTTLLAQVDSSVGGKTGFNLPEGKNLVGSFHQPRAVFIDHTFLRTLDDRNMRSGMAEVVKCAIAGDAVLWEKLCSRGAQWRAMSGPEWHDIISRSVSFKASVVEKDERESSTRRILNLGHTIGHALERAAGYGNLLHGEAVAMGLVWEAILSRRMGVTPPDVEERLFTLMKQMGFALDDPRLPLTSIAGAVGMDKKRIVSEVEMPLVSAPGSCVLRRIPLSELRKELPGIRAEIQKRGREAAIDSAEEREMLAMMDKGDLPAVRAILERRVGSNPRDLRAMVLLSEAYLRSGMHVGAWEMIKEALQQYPADQRTQRVAREIEVELRRFPNAGDDSLPSSMEDVIVLEGGSLEIRPADLSAGSYSMSAGVPDAEAPAAPAPPVRTVTMANVCWEQGEKEIARRIIDEILMQDPGDLRALEWKRTHEERTAETVLAAFLDAIAKEYGYDLPGPH